jgi:hypothetical protein
VRRRLRQPGDRVLVERDAERLGVAACIHLGPVVVGPAVVHRVAREHVGRERRVRLGRRRPERR